MTSPFIVQAPEASPAEERKAVIGPPGAVPLRWCRIAGRDYQRVRSRRPWPRGRATGFFALPPPCNDRDAPPCAEIPAVAAAFRERMRGSQEPRPFTVYGSRDVILALLGTGVEAGARDRSLSCSSWSPTLRWQRAGPSGEALRHHVAYKLRDPREALTWSDPVEGALPGSRQVVFHRNARCGNHCAGPAITATSGVRP